MAHPFKVDGLFIGGDRPENPPAPSVDKDKGHKIALMASEVAMFVGGMTVAELLLGPQGDDEVLATLQLWLQKQNDAGTLNDI